MAQAGNPFFVDPTLGSENMLGLTQALGQNIGGIIEERQRIGVENDFKDAIANKDYDRALEISSTNPEFQRFAMEQAGISDERQRQAMARGYTKFLSTKDPEQRKDILAGMADEVSMLGGQPDDIVEMMASELDPSSDTEMMAKASLLGIAPDIYDRLYPRQQKLADRRTMSERHSDRYEQIKKREGVEAADDWYDKFVLQGRGTLGEKTAADIERAQAKADISTEAKAKQWNQKSQAERQQGYIDSGIEAADALTGLRRAKELAETLKTGGIQDAILSGREWLGLSGNEDEAELKNRLSMNVLQQLKPIFGAAFTDAEGKRLENIMSKFSRSSGANVRLLEDAINTANRAVRRAVRAAEDQGGRDFEIEEIKRAAPWLFGGDSATPTETQQARTVNWGDM